MPHHSAKKIPQVAVGPPMAQPPTLTLGSQTFSALDTTMAIPVSSASTAQAYRLLAGCRTPRSM